MYQQFFKRVLDYFFAALMLICLSWLLILILMLYLISLELPFFFKQERIGKNNKPFFVFKFRTLREGIGSLEQRRFWLGDFLRFFSLDELPQLWNILRGEMSLIGPRPLPVEYLSLMNEDQRRRHAVLPGITGWTQVNGRHGISWSKKFELDNFYVENISLRLDFLITIKTILLVLSFKKDVSLEEEKFKGR